MLLGLTDGMTVAPPPVRLRPLPLDISVSRSVIRGTNEHTRRRIEAVSNLGRGAPLLVGSGALWLYWRAVRPCPDRAAGAGTVFAAVAASALACQNLKRLVARDRPDQRDPRGRWVRYRSDGAGQSFPSEHAAHAAALASVIWRLAPSYGAAAFAAAGAVAAMRVIARKHYASDALAGCILGRALGRAVASVLLPPRPGEPRHRTRSSPTTALAKLNVEPRAEGRESTD